jgi:hypothetical protein
LGDDHQITLNAEDLLATIYKARQMWMKADTMLRKLLRKATDLSKKYGEGIWSLKTRLSFAAQQLQHYEEAEQLCAEVLEQ